MSKINYKTMAEEMSRQPILRTARGALLEVPQEPAEVVAEQTFAPGPVPAQSPVTLVAPAAFKADALPAAEKGTISLNFKIYPEHAKALREAAADRRDCRGKGRADYSEVLRDLLDQWVENRRVLKLARK